MSSRKPTNIGKFNQCIEQLLKICLKYAPEDKVKSIEYYQFQLELGQNSNPRMVVEKVMHVLSKHTDHIMTRDDKFFMDYDLSSIPVEGQAVGLLDSLRDVWRHVEDNTKDKVWQALQLVLMYGVLVTRDQIQLDIINKYRSTPLVLQD